MKPLTPWPGRPRPSACPRPTPSAKVTAMDETIAMRPALARQVMLGFFPEASEEPV